MEEVAEVVVQVVVDLCSARPEAAKQGEVAVLAGRYWLGS